MWLYATGGKKKIVVIVSSGPAALRVLGKKKGASSRLPVKRRIRNGNDKSLFNTCGGEREKEGKPPVNTMTA